jgi:CheY-like chemotaxis protein
VSGDDATQIITAVAQLLGVLLWPAVVLFVIVYFRHAIGHFLSNLGELRVKGPGGIEATARSTEAAAALGVAVGARVPRDLGGVGPTANPKEIAAAVPSPREQRRLQGSRVLWVDDAPDNNTFEKQALEALGIYVDISTSTDNALVMMSGRPYDLVISDMGRPPDLRAGYTLLDSLRDRGNSVPFVIYSGSRAPEHIREALEHGAVGATSLPSELLEIVTAALISRR